jgi:hypothetical protein
MGGRKKGMWFCYVLIKIILKTCWILKGLFLVLKRGKNSNVPQTKKEVEMFVCKIPNSLVILKSLLSLFGFSAAVQFLWLYQHVTKPLHSSCHGW